MNLAGHLAVSALLGQARGAPWRAVLLGSLTPDLIDKSALLLELTPYGRTVGHSLWLWGWLTVGWALARARRLPRRGRLGALVLGGWGHLATDLIDDAASGLQYSGFVFSGWMGWPVTDPDTLSVRAPALLPRQGDMTSALEVLTVLGCAALLARRAAAADRA